MSGAFGTNWMDLSSTSNRYIQTYYKGFVDISGGPLYVRNNNLYVQGGDVSLNGRLYSAGDASFSNRVFVSGNLVVSGNITGTYPNSSIPSSAIIGGGGGSNFTTDVSINQRLIVLGDTSLNSRLYVGSDASFGGRLYVKNDTLLTGNLTLNNGSSYINPNTANASSYSLTYNGINWTASASSDKANGYAYMAFDNTVIGPSSNRWVPSNASYSASNGLYIGGITTTIQNSVGSVAGEWLQIQSSVPFVMNGFSITSWASSTNGLQEIPNNFYICGSNDGSTWYPLIYISFTATSSFTATPTGSLATPLFMIPSGQASGATNVSNIVYNTYNNSTNTYTYFRMVITKQLGTIVSGGTNDTWVSFAEWTPYFSTGSVSNITLNLDSTASNQLNLSNNLSVGGKLISVSDASMNNRLFVGSDASFGGNLFSSGLFTAGGGLSVTGTLALPTASISDSALSSNIITLTGTQTLTNKTLTSPVISSISNSGTITIPSGTDTLATLTGTETLTNKTLTAPVISSISNSGTITIPTGTDTLATLTGTETLTNKTLTTSGLLTALSDASLNSRLYVGSDVSFGGLLFVSNDASMNGNLSIDKDMTIGGNLYVKTYTTRQTITELSYQLIVAQDLSLNGRLFLSNDASINNRLFVGSDASFGGKLFSSGLFTAAGGLSVTGTVTLPAASIADSALSSNIVTLTGTQTLTNKTLTSPVISSISNSGTITIPTGTNTLATLTGTQTLTNKTLTSPVISSISNSGTITIPTGTNTLATLTGTETLTNKTLTTSGLLTANGGATINGNLAISASKGIYGGSTTAVASDLSVYGLNIGAGAFTAASDCYLNGNLTISTSKGISGGSTTAVASDLNVYGLNVGAGDIIVSDGGIIAIGTTNTGYGLFVNTTSAANVSITGGRLTLGAFQTNQSTTTASVAIRAGGIIWSENNIFVSSDIRIKTDINAINGNNALDKFRQLKPVEYYHIDKFECGTVKKYGFIAQDVIQIIPESISFDKDYIPNIYDAATVIDNSLIVLDTKTTNEFTLSGETINIQLYDYKNRSKTVTLDKIINSTSFTIKEPLLDSDLSNNKIFVFGQEVDDFHILSKETIFTLGTAALLEVDKELEKTKIVVNDISMNMPLYETRLSIAEQKLEEQSILIRQLQEQINQLKH